MDIEINIVTCLTYPQKFILDNVDAALVLPPVVIVLLPFVNERR